LINPENVDKSGTHLRWRLIFSTSINSGPNTHVDALRKKDPTGSFIEADRQNCLKLLTVFPKMHILNSVVEDINFLVNFKSTIEENLHGSESRVESIEFITQITINFLNYILVFLQLVSKY